MQIVPRVHRANITATSLYRHKAHLPVKVTITDVATNISGTTATDDHETYTFNGLRPATLHRKLRMRGSGPCGLSRLHISSQGSEMKCSFIVIAVWFLAFAAASPALAAEPQRAASGHKGLVVSGEAAATEAGIKMLEHGGNAADATLLALSVTKVGAFCIGGEIPVLIFDAAKKEVKVLSGQGAAPLDPKAIDWYLKHGIPGSNIRSAAVPAALDAIVTLLRLYGTNSFEEAVLPTLAILDAGGPSWYIDTSDGRRMEPGHNWQAELAVTFRKLIEAEHKSVGSRKDRLQAVADRFCRGDIADALERWYIAQGGFLRKADLAAHVLEPLLFDAIQPLGSQNLDVQSECRQRHALQIRTARTSCAHASSLRRFGLSNQLVNKRTPLTASITQCI
jgi:gamma-glutamyltranspeptidase